MWQYHGLIALDLAHERAREAQAEAERWRLARETEPVADLDLRRERGVRSVVAWPVRAFGDVTHALSHAACEAATRIEGRTA
jgi:hypothetical protein